MPLPRVSASRRSAAPLGAAITVITFVFVFAGATASAGVVAAVPRQPPPPGPPRRLLRPVPGPIVRHFDAPLDDPYAPGSRGLDFSGEQLTSVRAAAGGVVTFAGVVAGTRYVSLDHGNGLATRYGGLGASVVSAGDRVDAGAVLGVIGDAGSAGPARLHFSLLVDGRYADPEPWFRAARAHLVPWPSR